MTTFVNLLNLAPGVNAAGFLALAYLLHLLVVERSDVALPHLHDVVTDLAVEALYTSNVIDGENRKYKSGLPLLMEETLS